MNNRTIICSLIISFAFSGHAVSDDGSFDRTNAVIEAIKEYGYEETLNFDLMRTDPELNEDVGFCWSGSVEKKRLMRCVNKAYATHQVCGFQITIREMVDCWAEKMDKIEQRANELKTKQTLIDDRIAQAKHEIILDIHAKRHADWLAAEEIRQANAAKQREENP